MAVFPTKFVADVGNYTLATNASQQMELVVHATTVLKEQYNVCPSNMQITVRGLREVLSACLYGEMKTGLQTHACDDVILKLGGTAIERRKLYASRLRNPRDPLGAKRVLAAGDIVIVGDHEGDLAGDGTMIYTHIRTDEEVETVSIGGTGAEDTLIDGEVNVHTVFSSCLEQGVSVRFLNRYDMPQTMMTPYPLEVKPAFEDNVAMMGGVRTRYSVKATDEYTLRSAPVHSMAEYASWHDLITSRLAQVYMGDRWHNIIVTKSNFAIVKRSLGLNPVEITFQMADQTVAYNY